MKNAMEQITASAGSGKTYTLTRRFLERLAKALPDGGPSLCLIEETHKEYTSDTSYSLAGILAATFTNKAATEMQARVIRELKLQALASGEGDTDFPLTPEEARRWLKVILRRFDAVNIRTIDSLLTLLVRLNALSLSLPPDFTPLFSLEDTLLPLYESLLDKAATSPATETLFREACRSLLFHHKTKGVGAGKILFERLQEIITLHLNGATLPNENDTRKARAIFTALHQDMLQAATALAQYIDRENLSLGAHAKNFLHRCASCPEFTTPAFSDTYAQKESFDDWLNKASKGKASKDADAACADLIAAHNALRKYGPALHTTLEFAPLIALAKPLIAELDILQKNDGLVPASKLPSLALASLENGGISDAFCRLGNTLAHLLFDEFQDTSTDQWAAILPLVSESLSRGGSLTYVGDVKQAIYGWRGGNAALFNAVAEDTSLTNMLEKTDMLEKGVTRSTLPYNWRSAPPIIAANNTVFGRLGETPFARRVLDAVLPAKTDPALLAESARNLAAAFSNCEQQVPEKNAEKPGFVRLQKVEASNNSALLQAVREKMENLLHNEILPRRTPGEIAILVRKNSEASEVADWLTQWRIPAVTEHSFCLGSHPIITRIVDTLLFLEYPPDDAAFWSAVNGPELFAHLGCPDETTRNAWLAQTRLNASGGPLYAHFRRDFPMAWKNMLAPFHDQAGLLSAYDAVCEIIRHCGLYARFPEHTPFLRRFAEVAHTAESNGHSSLSAFLEYWNNQGTKERVPMPENMNAVRILSMHKAKGLEFPVVIVPFHHQAEPGMRPLAVSKEFGLPLIAYRSGHDPESVRGMIESINLLYVAWTRPTEELYAFITESRHSASRSALGKALGAILEDVPFTDGIFEQGVIPQREVFPAFSSPQPTDILPDTMPEAVPSLQPSETQLEPPAPLMAWLPRLKIFRNPLDKGFSERQRGLLAHACLEYLRLTGDAATDAAKAVDQGLRAFPVPMPDPEAVRRDMEEVIAWYAALPEAAAWLHHGSPEQAIMDTDGHMHRIDLLADIPGKPLLAVEYKTGQPSPKYTEQVARYISLLEPVVCRKNPGREVQGVIVYLDKRTLVPVVAGKKHQEAGRG